MLTIEFADCKFFQTDLSKSLIQNAKFKKCTLETVDLSYAKLKSIDFTGSIFKGVNFDFAGIVRGIFTEVKGLERKQFYCATLDDCTFDWLEAFIIMEFNNSTNDNLYKYGIEEVLKARKVDPKRVDKYEFHGRITDEILQNIVTSRLVIAECSQANKNVFFEVGYALGKNKKVIFLVDKAENIPFDLKDFPFIIHNGVIDKLKVDLEKRVDFYLQNNSI